MRGLLAIIAVCAAGLVVFSFLGRWHPAADSFAVFRPLLIAGLLMSCALIWRWRIAKGLAVVAILVAAWHGIGGVLYEGPKQGVSIKVYQKNLLYLPSERLIQMEDIRASGADVVTLQEVSSVNQHVLEVLRSDFPYQLSCDAHAVGAVAILSRTPLQDQECARGMARAVSQVNGRKVQIISLHMHWPWPFGQHDHIAELLPRLAPLEDGATVIGGDFNMVASGYGVTAFEEATQTERVGPMVRTYSLRGYPLGIDHVLATGGAGLLSVRSRMGSDHFGLLAQIDLF